MALVDVKFTVSATLSRGHLCLTGDAEALGAWKLDGAVCMERCQNGENRLTANGSSTPDQWTTTVQLPVDSTVQYRYAKCVSHEDTGLPSMMDEGRYMAVLEWETHLVPRKWVAKDGMALVDEFGTVLGGQQSVDRGWLTDQTEVIIKLHNNPVHFLKRSLHDRPLRVRCTPVDLSVSESQTSFGSDEESLHYDRRFNNHPFPVYVSALRSVEDCRPREQTAKPELYNNGDFLIFRTQTFKPDTMGLKFEIYAEARTPDEEPRYLGTAFHLPVPASKPSSGARTVQITGHHHHPVGQINLEYLYIRPMPDDLCDFSKSYARYWNTVRDPLDIGHRGMGSTKAREACIPENTIHSFNTAGEHGADYVEFDVQLCKDLNVVVYHDFKVCLTLKKKKQGGNEFHEQAVKDLTLEQLQRLRLDHAEVLGEGSGVCPNEEHDPDHPEDWQVFPTLEQVFDRVDPLIGFDVEIKYPMALADGKHEMEHFFDQNLYVDRILETVLSHAGQRRVMLTCFDPDICSMLALKQVLFPVFFTCQGQTPVFPEYFDSRARQLKASLLYAAHQNCLGISAFYEELIKNMELFTKIKDEGLILFVWGALKDRETIGKLKKLGVDGLIYDKINQLKGTPNVFHLEQQAKLANGETSSL